MKNKGHFTLLEMLVVFLILALGAALTGVKVRNLYQDQQFLFETKEIEDHLRMAQDLMLIMDTDVLVRFKRDQEGQWSVKTEVERPLRAHWAKLIERELFVPSIKEIHFNGRDEKELSLRFVLGMMSRGKLEFFGKNEDLSQEITLPGYPVPIGQKIPFLESHDKMSRSESLFPQLVYEELYEQKQSTKK